MLVLPTPNPQWLVQCEGQTAEWNTKGCCVLKCDTCQDEYVAGTMKALEVRMKEHRDANRLNHPQKSAVAEHVLQRNG